MYTIFKNDTSIILTDILNDDEISIFFYWDRIRFKDLIKRIDNREFDKIILYHEDLDFLWEEFLKYFKVIQAAGGVIQNSVKNILFIFRNGKWDLPKGKVEKNESIEEAALREVIEECGLTNVEIVDYIFNTFHIYSENGRDVLKVSHWFNMVSDDIKVYPQLEEDITEVVWKNKQEVKLALNNTYPNIKLLVDSLR